MSGGGPKGAWQAGVNVALDEHWKKLDEQPKVWAGVSAGAINGVYRAQGYSGERLVEMWESEISGDSSVYRHHLPFFYLTGYSRGSLYDSTPLQDDILIPNVRGAKIRELGNKLRLGAVSLSSGRYHVFTEELEDKRLVEGVMASAAHPIFLSMVQARNPETNLMEWWTDGGVRHMTPLRSAIDAGATKVYVVLTKPRNGLSMWKTDDPNLKDRTLRELEILIDETQADDLKICQWINAACRAGAPEAQGRRLIEVVDIRPREPIDFDGLEFDPEKIRKAIDQGYNDAREALAL
jgi:NTE family protein